MRGGAAVRSLTGARNGRSDCRHPECRPVIGKVPEGLTIEHDNLSIEHDNLTIEHDNLLLIEQEAPLKAKRRDEARAAA